MKKATEDKKLKACLKLWLSGATLTQIAAKYNLDQKILSKTLSEYDGRSVAVLKEIRWQNMVNNIIDKLLPKVGAKGYRPKWKEVFQLCDKKRPLANAVFKEFKNAELIKAPARFTTCTPENTATAVRLTFEGKERNQIAKEMKMTRYQVDLILRRYALKHPNKISNFLRTKYRKQHLKRGLELAQKLGRLPLSGELNANPRYHKEILDYLKKKGFKP